jgi:phosphoglycolate phosphatase/pyrophosphatase PpaX
MLFSCDDPREQRKPSAYPIQTIMHAFGLKEEDILVVDDLKIGYEMAKNAGVKMAFAGWGRQASPALCAEMAKLCDHSFHNVANLHKFLFEV